MSTVIQTEEVRAQYLAPSLKDLPTLRRVDGRGQRFYYTIDDSDVRIYPSVTSIIRATMPTPSHLIRWWCDQGYEGARETLRRKAAYGTLFHICAAQFMTTRVFDLEAIPEIIAEYRVTEGIDFDTSSWEYELQRDMLSFAAFCVEREVEPLAIEVSILSERLGYAGTIDLVCDMTFNRKRVRAVVDLKSGRGGFYEEYEIQLEAYRELWNDVAVDLPATMIFNFAPKDWRKEPTYTLENQTEKSSLSKWPLLLGLYDLADEKKPAPFTRAFGTIRYGADLTGNYEVVDIEEHLRRQHDIQASTIIEEAADVSTF